MLVVYGFNINVAFYYLSMVVFLFWNFIDIYQLGTLAMLDSRGRYCALTSAAQGLAMTLAPACAGYLLGQSYGYASVLFLGAFGVLFSFVAYSLVYYRLKKIRPSLT
jgi:predicted MFS family arabinose efflux permease